MDLSQVGHSWTGWSPYSQFMAKLKMANPGLYATEQMAPQEFRAAAASQPFTNTPTRASSTFVRNIRYLPNSQTSFVKLGPNTYWYKMSPNMLSHWLNSRSLGQYYNRYIKLR